MRYLRIIMPSLMLFIGACGGGSGSSEDSDNNSPIANAGPDQQQLEKLMIRVSGQGSSDPGGNALSYAWTQSAGPSVDLENPDQVDAIFKAPRVDTQQVVELKLIVTDNNGGSDSDTVQITIVPSPWVTYRDIAGADFLPQQTRMKQDPGDPQRVYSSEEKSSLVRADFADGATTELLPQVVFFAPNPVTPSTIVAFGSENPDASHFEYDVLESRDSGATWKVIADASDLGGGDLIRSTKYHFSAFSSDGVALIAYEHDHTSSSTSGPGFRRSTDGGINWETPINAAHRGHGPADFSPARPELLYIFGGHFSLERSTDYAASVTEVDRHQDGSCGTDGQVVFADPFDRNKVVVVSLDSEGLDSDICLPHVRVSNNSGEAFASSFLNDFPALSGVEFNACASPVTEDVYYIGYIAVKEHMETHRDQAMVIKSEDGGNTWEALNDLTPHVGLPPDQFGEFLGGFRHMSCAPGPNLGETAIYVGAGPNEGVARYLDKN